MKVLLVDHSQRHARSEVLGMHKAWSKVADVCFFDYRDLEAKRGGEDMNAFLCKTAEALQPDIVQLGKAESISGETVKFIKERTPAVALLWFGDLRLEVPAHIATKGRYADWTLLFHKDPRLIGAYEKAGCRRVGYCGWGFDPDVYHPYPGGRTLDVAFAGHLYARERGARLAMIKALVDAGLDVHTYGPLQYAGNFGEGWQQYADEWGFTAHPFTDMDDVARVYSSAKIAPGLSNDQAYFHFGLRRAYESMACGALHLVRYAPGMEEIFEDHHHLVWWRNFKELAELARYYVAHDAECEAIAEAGRKLVLENYTWDHAIQRYLRYVEMAKG